MKELDINNYDPKTIFGSSVGNEWFESINMVVPTFIDPDVVRIYRMCLDWDSYDGPFVKSGKKLNRENQIKLAVQSLISKYNTEIDKNNEQTNDLVE